MQEGLAPQSGSEARLDAIALSSANTALERALERTTPERRMIFEELQQRTWFQNTAGSVKIELALLPDGRPDPRNNFDGFLKDLAGRPERVANNTVLSLDRVARGNFAIVPVFNVISDQGVKNQYEYVSWRYGPQSGVKGLVLIEKDGAPTHFIVLRTEKFATGKMETDSVGGFIDLKVEGVENAIGRFKKEIEQELGLPAVKLLREPVDLGSVTVDAGMTNNRPGMFLASIDASQASRIPERPTNLDPYEMQGNIEIYPIDQLREVVMQNGDAFFLGCVARGWASGLIPIERMAAKLAPA